MEPLDSVPRTLKFELRPSSPPSTYRATAGITRVSGLRLEEDDWIGPNGRRTAIAEALLRIAIGSE